jgi:hypothetical protein
MMMQRRLLHKPTHTLMPPEVIQPWKPPLTPQMMPLANHMLMLGPVRRHMSAKIAPFGIQKLAADMAVGLIRAGMGRKVFVQDLFVHKGLLAAREGAFEGAVFFGLGAGEVFLGNVPCQSGFGGEGGGGAAGPGALQRAFGGVYGFDVFA